MEALRSRPVLKPVGSFEEVDLVELLSSPHSTSSSSSLTMDHEESPLRSRSHPSAVATQRERNRLAQQRSRRLRHSHLVLLRHRNVQSYERETEMRNQLLSAAESKREALALAEAQAKQIEELREQLRSYEEAAAALKAKYSIVANGHTRLLEAEAMAHHYAAQAMQSQRMPFAKRQFY